ncbi:MAG: alpha/beta hydrolase [Thermomicrobiales bacterium]
MTEKQSPLPHANAPVLHTGAPLEDPELVVIMLHGRGASAENILGLSRDIAPIDGGNDGRHDRISWLAPQADGNQWYPYPFRQPLEQNEPWLSGALATIDRIIDRVHASRPELPVVLAGFSQGACLSLEYLARGSRSIAGVAAFSGGLIGPSFKDRLPIKDLTGSWVFIGCGDQDHHIPIDVAETSGKLIAATGADVDFRRYPEMPHTIVADETNAVRVQIATTLGTHR